MEERVLKAIRAWDRFPADKETLLKLEADFLKDLGFDSLDHVSNWGLKFAFGCVVLQHFFRWKS